MNYLIAKYSEWENNTNRKKTVAEQAIARVRASNTTLLSISRKPRGAVNLDECIVDYDFVDSDGTLMDLSVRCVNKRDRVFNYLTRKIYKYKVGCIFPVVISSEFRMEQYRDDDYREDALHCNISYSSFIGPQFHKGGGSPIRVLQMV